MGGRGLADARLPLTEIKRPQKRRSLREDAQPIDPPGGEATPTDFYVAICMIAACEARASIWDDDLMTHLTLQKLVDFAQGASLHYVGEPLFHEPMKAWIHGPFARTCT